MKKSDIKLTKAQKKRFDGLSLTIELVPVTCWCTNVRSNVTRSQWDKLRKEVYDAAGHKCEICGGIGKKHAVECHEIWEYDDKKKIQSLGKFIAICPLCHQVKHPGVTKRVSGQEGTDRANKRFQSLNRLSKSEAELFRSYFWLQFQERSKHEWSLDISHLDKYTIDIRKTKFSDNEREKDEVEIDWSNYVESDSERELPSPINYKIDANDFKCPNCDSREFTRHGKLSSGKFRYKCKECNVNFSTFIDTTAWIESARHLTLD